MLRLTLSMAVFLLFSFTLYAQDDYKALDWGDIDPSDLAMTTYDLDSTARAVVLADEGYAVVRNDESSRYQYVLRRHRRVKILREAGIQQYGDVNIYFYHNNNRDALSNGLGLDVAQCITIISMVT